MLDYDLVKNWTIPAERQRYTRHDTILYNLGVGANVIDRQSEIDLDLVWEERLRALPTMAAVLAIEPYWYHDKRTGIGWEHSVHGEQSIEWHGVIPPEGEIVGESSVEEVYDKGVGRGALMVLRRTLSDGATGARLATVRQTVFLRKDGGFGGTAIAPPPRPVPERAPDLVWTSRTRPEQALIYRLSGDYFPLHIDPEFARNGGFAEPILHGLCTYGVTGHALIDALCNGDGSRLKRLDARFSAPVIPGETIETQIWQTGDGEASYRCRIGDRTVINNGYVRFT